MKKELASHDIIKQIFASSDDMKMLMDSSSNVCDAQVQTKAKEKQSETFDQHTRAHFVEIGEYSCGSMFGLGEHMEDRVIVAKHTEVQCLLIPHYWIFQKKQNAGNIWQR